MKSKLLGLALFAPFVLYACSDSKDSSSDDTTDNGRSRRGAAHSHAVHRGRPGHIANHW